MIVFGVQKKVGSRPHWSPLGFNSKFLTSIPTPFIWECPLHRVLNESGTGTTYDCIGSRDRQKWEKKHYGQQQVTCYLKVILAVKDIPGETASLRNTVIVKDSCISETIIMQFGTQHLWCAMFFNLHAAPSKDPLVERCSLVKVGL